MNIQVHESLEIEADVLRPGDTINCEVPEEFQIGDLVICQVTGEGLVVQARITAYSMATDAGRRIANDKRRQARVAAMDNCMSDAALLWSVN